MSNIVVSAILFRFASCAFVKPFVSATSLLSSLCRICLILLSFRGRRQEKENRGTGRCSSFETPRFRMLPPTPRQLPAGIEESPSHPSNNMVCRHFCPICMLYYRSAFEAKCCGNTICEPCVTSILRRVAGHSAWVHSILEASTPLKRQSVSGEPQLHDKSAVDNSAVSLNSPEVGGRGSAAATITTTGTTSTAAPPTRPYVRQALLVGAVTAQPPIVQSITPCPFCQRSLKVRVLAEHVASKSYKDSPVAERSLCRNGRGNMPAASPNGSDQQTLRECSNTSKHPMDLTSEGGVYSATMTTFRRGGALRTHGGPSLIASTGSITSGIAVPSPVKTGDSFEALRRKLVPMPTMVMTGAASMTATKEVCGTGSAGGLPPLHAHRENHPQPPPPAVDVSESGSTRGGVSSTTSGSKAAATAAVRGKRRLSDFGAASTRQRMSLPAVAKAVPAVHQQPSSWCPIM